MIVRAKGYRMVIDWKMAYDELKKITYNMKVGMRKKKPKPAPKGILLSDTFSLMEFKPYLICTSL